jgi:hypothetical protein
LDGRPTKVGRKSNGRPTKVGRVELNRRCGDGGRQRFLATLQRWPGALQLAALLRRWPAMHWRLQRSCGAAAAMRWTSQRYYDGQQRAGRCNVAAMASNTLDVATLLRWPAMHWTSQRCCDGGQRVGPRSVLLRCPAARWASERYCDVRQRYNSGQRCVAMFLFFFFFFTRQLEVFKKKNGEREKF